MNILLSLKPVYADAILSGKKRYEFRRVIFKNTRVKKAYIYVTSPVGKIVGSFVIGKILVDTPQRIWQKCRKYAGISAKAFFEYYQGCEKAFAIKIQSVQNFVRPVDPYSKMANFRAPQSFQYVTYELHSEHVSLLDKIRGIYRTLTPLVS